MIRWVACLVLVTTGCSTMQAQEEIAPPVVTPAETGSAVQPDWPAQTAPRALAQPDTASLSENDADMFRLAFRVLLGVAPPPPGMPLCVSIGRQIGANTPSDPPTGFIARLTAPLHAGYPASQCVMDTAPMIAGAGEQAQWYNVWIREQRADGSRVLVLNHIYGNLGAQAYESIAVRTNDGWTISQPVLRAIS